MGESYLKGGFFNNMREKEGCSIGYLKKATTSFSYTNRLMASEILGRRQDLSTSNKSFTGAVSEYLKNSEELLDFCSALDKFVKSVRDSHSYTQYVVQQYFENKMETEYCLKILEKLKKLKSSEDIHAHYAESLLRKIESLRAQFVTLQKILGHEIAKIDEEENLIGSRKKRASLVFKITAGLLCATVVGFDVFDIVPNLEDIVTGLADVASGLADVASNVADVASNVADGASGVGDAALGASDIATHPHIESVQEKIVDFAQVHDTASKHIVKARCMAAAGAATDVGHSLLMSNYENKENDLDNQKKCMDAARRKNTTSISELGNIQFLIDQLVNQVDSLLAKTNTAIKMSDIDYLMKDMKQKLEEFMKKIDDLDAEAGKCAAETLQARDDVCGLIKL